MSSLNHKSRNLLSGPHLLGTLLLIAGLFALISPTFLESGSSPEKIAAVGIGAVILGLIIVTSYRGTIIDFAKHRFKDYQTIGGYKFGHWTPMPEILQVKVVSHSYISHDTPNGVSPTLSGKVTDLKTFVYTGDATPFLSFDHTSRDKAVKYATQLANNLHVELIVNIPEHQ